MPQKPVSPKRRWLKRLLLASLIATAAYAAWTALTWPDVSKLTKDKPESTAFIDAYRNRWFRADRDVEWKWVPYSKISRNLKRAVLVGEDAAFFGHEGFDTEEMKAALEDAWEDKRLPRGASTISQQLAKNLYLSPSRNPLRKVEEALLTHQLEQKLSKKRILEIYLNIVEFGPGVYGAEAAARHYFKKSCASLTEHQAASLAASLPSPKNWHPGSDSRRYKSRVRMIERRMKRARWITGRV